MAHKLSAYLSELNCSDSTQFLYVDPEDLDRFVIAQVAPAGFVCIGSLDCLSFGYQNRHDALKQWLANADGSFSFSGQLVHFDIDGLLDAYFDGKLADDMYDYLTERIDEIVTEWSQVEADFFISETMPDMLAQHQADRHEEYQAYWGNA
jgi:hypothetical protein